MKKSPMVKIKNFYPRKDEKRKTNTTYWLIPPIKAMNDLLGCFFDVPTFYVALGCYFQAHSTAVSLTVRSVMSGET